MDVVLEVAAEAVDPLAQHGDLDLSGTRVGAVGLVGVDQLLLLGGIKRHARGAALSVQTTTLPGQGALTPTSVGYRPSARRRRLHPVGLPCR